MRDIGLRFSLIILSRTPADQPPALLGPFTHLVRLIYLFYSDEHYRLYPAFYIP